MDPTFVLKAFAEGADGVLIAGCHPGDCHYINGNYRTAGRFPLLEKLLEQIGLEPAACASSGCRPPRASGSRAS